MKNAKLILFLTLNFTIFLHGMEEMETELPSSQDSNADIQGSQTPDIDMEDKDDFLYPALSGIDIDSLAIVVQYLNEETHGDYLAFNTLKNLAKTSPYFLSTIQNIIPKTNHTQRILKLIQQLDLATLSKFEDELINGKNSIFNNAKFNEVNQKIIRDALANAKIEEIKRARFMATKSLSCGEYPIGNDVYKYK